MAILEPLLPPNAKKTYSVLAPKSTHFRKANCAEVECAGMEHGWVSLIDERTELGQRQAAYIRAHSGRKFTEERDEQGRTMFTFEAGQACFTEHQVSLGRPELYIVRDGDLRGLPKGGSVQKHVNGEDWADDFATHQQKIADAIQEG